PESLRASDAERDHAVGELRNEFVEGRLSHETFMYRMQTALDARHRGQQAAGPSYEQARPRIPPPPHAWPGPSAPALGNPPLGNPAPPPATPAPLAFPPGSGVRFTIGRTRDCDLCLTDLSVSRMHALLVRREDGWVLSDLGSHNGTRLNGWLVREAVRVRAADRVEFGSMPFNIQDDQPTAPAGQQEDEGPGPADEGPKG